jgi:hypothetical protein
MIDILIIMIDILIIRVNFREVNLCLLSLLGQKDSLDVGEDTTLGNGDSGKKLVQFIYFISDNISV